MRCGNAGECLHQQLQVSRIDVKCLRLLRVALVEKCYKISVKKEQIGSLSCIGCVQEKRVLILLCSHWCTEVVVVGGSRTCSGLY